VKGRGAAALLVVAAAAVMFALTMSFIGGSHVGEDPAESPGSIENRHEDGAYAWAETLRRLGYDVGSRDRAFDDGALPGRGTLVLVDVDDVGQSELDALAQWLSDSVQHRVVVVGDSDPKVLRRLVPNLDTRSLLEPSKGDRIVAVAPAPESAGADELQTGGFGPRLFDPGDGVAVYGLDATPSAAYVIRYDDLSSGGTTVGVADDAALANDGLAEGDNAAFAAALAGSPSDPVIFDQFHHQPAKLPGTFGWLPRNVQYLLIQLVVVGIVLAAAAGIRRAPPLPEPDVLPRRRIEFVDALARVNSDAGGFTLATAQIQADVRDRLRTALRAGHDVDDRGLVAASAQLGLDAERVAAVLFAVPSDSLGFQHIAAEAAVVRRGLQDGVVARAGNGIG